MYREYKIFEVLPNGSPRKVRLVSGLEFAKVVLEALAKHTTNECFAADTKTHQVVMQLNVPPAKFRATNRIFQISYDRELGFRRAELLRSLGHGVISVVGNRAAKLLLSAVQRYNFFIVGHAATEEIRAEMVDWLRAHYSGVKILALNPPDQEVLRADYNACYNESEIWLRIVSLELGNTTAGPQPAEASTSGSPTGSVHADTPGANQLQVLCHEHHLEMRMTEVLLAIDNLPSRTPAYGCPEPACAVRYTVSSGYFLAPTLGHVELDGVPRVTCPRDGAPMYLAELNPEKRAFRLWRCPQCNSIRTNEAALVTTHFSH